MTLFTLLPLAVTFGEAAPLLILVASVVFIVVAIAVCRLHAFFALILAAAFVGLLSALTQEDPKRFTLAIDSVMGEFGRAAGNIAFTIAIAAVIGFALMESGAADKIVRRMIATLGEKRAGLALVLSGFILAIPVFFDTVFFLLIPLARALSLRTGGNYLLYLLAICAGGVVTHGTVPPTPGPLVVADTLKLDLGVAMVGGMLFGILPTFSGYLTARWLNRRTPVPLRPTQGESLDSLGAAASRSESELPGMAVSIAPVLLPVVLIAAASSLTLFPNLPTAFAETVRFLGHKNIALLIGAVIALSVYAYQKRIGGRQVNSLLGGPLETAGVIILITAAGGAYGAMIKNSGIGEAVRAMAGNSSINYVLLAWIMAAVIRAAQGSATVGMITSVGILYSIAGAEGFGVHPVYVFLSVGYGATFMSWMNDSGFWVVGRLGGLTQGEMLRTWTIMLNVISLVGLIQVLIASKLFPNFFF